MEKYFPAVSGKTQTLWRRFRSRLPGLLVLPALCALAALSSVYYAPIPPYASSAILRCRGLNLTPVDVQRSHKRIDSDRFDRGTKPVLLKNARIWTGERNGTEIISGNVFLDQGVIKNISQFDIVALDSNTIVIDAKNAWVTPGIVDMHSHLGIDSIPELRGASDTNSFNGPVQPWLRSVDAINTHDDSYSLSIAGGVTTALVLPGSANAIGGQAFTIKLRKTLQRTTSAMLLEPPRDVNTSHADSSLPPRWRHMKHACGENPGRIYQFSRMDTVWSLREAYAKAREIKSAQDMYCSKVAQGQWAWLMDSPFPEDLQWEALVDVLRGRVKVHAHCYEAVDLDSFVRLSNEFNFPIASVHHATEAYLVPDLLKRAYGQPPAVALFAQNSRYKREAYRASEFAPRVLTENGLRVVMKSDHPVLNSRYLLYEAQVAHYFGLEEGRALSSVTAFPADVMGLGWRIGYVKEGWDADLVIWDSHPLALGATPIQVFIDGIPQLEDPHVVHKPPAFQEAPAVPNFDKQAKQAVEFEGLPPLEPMEASQDLVVFKNVQGVWGRGSAGIIQMFEAQNSSDLRTVLVRRGEVICIGLEEVCLAEVTDPRQWHPVDLKGGEISPALVSFGSPLGLSSIEAEASTSDGPVYDPLSGNPHALAGNTIVKAVDGLEFATRDALLAYREGVTTAITAPNHNGFFAGLSTHVSTRALHKLEAGAVLQNLAALHVSVLYRGNKPGMSTQIGVLRTLLLGLADGVQDGPERWWQQVTAGKIPLVVEAHSADVIASLILLKKEVEAHFNMRMKLTITGASEAHLLVEELADAAVGVIVNPVRPFPTSWQRRRILPGPPISARSAIARLLSSNVTVGVGVEEIWSARNTRLDIAWASLEAGGQITKAQALALGSTNVENLLGGRSKGRGTELVATAGGGLLEFGSQVVAVLSTHRGTVDLFL